VVHQETPCNLVTFRSLAGPADLLRTTVVTRLARQAEAWRRTRDLAEDYAEGPTIASSAETLWRRLPRCRNVAWS